MTKGEYEFVPDWLVEKRKEIYDELTHEIHSLGECGHDDDRVKTEALLRDLFPHGRPTSNDMVEVRISLAVTENGAWSCSGASGLRQSDARSFALECAEDSAEGGMIQEYTVVVKVPKPKPIKAFSVERVRENES